MPKRALDYIKCSQLKCRTSSHGNRVTSYITVFLINAIIGAITAFVNEALYTWLRYLAIAESIDIQIM